MRDVQLTEVLTLSRWDHLSLADQEEAALAVASRLPEPFRFDGLETHELGQQHHRVAFFTWNRWRFALIPGGPTTLGYAPGSFQPTPVQQASWEETRLQYFAETSRRISSIVLIYPTLESYLQDHLTPLRQVTLQPFLLQVAPEIVDLHLRYPKIHQRPPTLSLPLSPAHVQEYVVQEEPGFRLPTSDEWEYACAAGARTLWRWGEEIPMTGVASREIPQPAWDVHLRPNAFGLLIGDEPQHLEYTAEQHVLRGGDGGGATCVGIGRLVEWLTLASAYWSELGAREGLTVLAIRRAYSLFAS